MMLERQLHFRPMRSHHERSPRQPFGDNPQMLCLPSSPTQRYFSSPCFPAARRHLIIHHLLVLSLSLSFSFSGGFAGLPYYLFCCSPPSLSSTISHPDSRDDPSFYHLLARAFLCL